MEKQFQFTFANLELYLTAALESGYEFITCDQYLTRKSTETLPALALVNRVDIDFSCKKARRVADIFNKLSIKGSFFVRLHAPEYNPFAFENYLVLKHIKSCGHEIGYHSEVVDQAAIWSEDATDCLLRDIKILNTMLDIEVKGVASHGGLTGLNNLDFWAGRKATDLDLAYEAYEKSGSFNLFNESFYISDSEWTRWKCYDKGELVLGDHRSLADHVKDRHKLIYLLTHPDTYFDRHFYE